MTVVHDPKRHARRVAFTFCMALIAVGCGSSDEVDSGDGTSSTAAQDVTQQVYPDDHDQPDDHTLAVGDDTPTDPQGRYFLHPGDRGPDVTLLQERLLALGAPIGAADDVYGDHTLHAVLAFQRSEGLTPDGVVGTATWASLDAPARSVDWNLPEVPKDYATGEPTTTASTGSTTTIAPRAGDGSAVTPQDAPRNDPAAGGGAWSKAVVSLSAQTATFYDAAGNVVLQAPISSGHDGLTPQGTFHVQSKSSRAFAGNGVYMDSMTRFNGGIGFHSIPKRASGEDLPTPLGQAPVSHGCIRMADAQAQQVYEHLPVGAVVEVHA